MVEYNNTDFNIKKLGYTYTSEKTIFRVFAPENDNLFLIINNHAYEMHKKDYTFQICLKGNLELVKYHYENEFGVCFKDPFAYYSDNTDSYVLDTNKFIKEVFIPNKTNDIFIYETSIRDFSSDDSYNGLFKKKFLSLAQSNLKLHDYYMIGLDYIKNLGYTHVQLMPLFEFDNDNTEYNWGYNPICFNMVEKDYVVNQNDPYAYINELRNVVNVLHKNNIRVCFDVVFNHVYRKEMFDLDKILPGHVFRYKEDGSLAEGTYCGNEIKSEDPFVRAYLLEMLERYIILFDVDGIRFDLMGIIDYETINLAFERLKAIKNDIIMYGEGWNMGDALNEDLRATIKNADKMPNISFFNDYFRDTIISYVCGNNSIMDEVQKCLIGSNNNLNMKQSINYVECHDNYTFFDRLMNYLNDDSLENNIRRCKLALSLCIVSRGIPFIHSGQEFLRTKNLVENSYNTGDNINSLDWNRRVEYNSICDYTKQLIDLRKNHGCFSNPNSNVRVSSFYECIVYEIDNIKIIINGTNYDYQYHDDRNNKVIFDDNGKCEYYTEYATIKSHSLLIIEN